MEANVGEPFVLNNYTNKVFASHSKGYVTVSAQGDGVHVIDLSTLHPVISHTLGQSTTFTCPSITLQDANYECSTYSASDNELWLWRENLASSVAERATQTQNKKTRTLPHLISGLYTTPALPSRILCTSAQGEITALHQDLATNTSIQATWSSKSKCTVLKAWVFVWADCVFLSTRSSPGGAIVVQMVEVDGRLRMLGVGVDLEDKFHEVWDAEVPLEYGAEAFRDGSVSVSGFVSILLSNGTWSSFQLQSADEVVYLNTLDTIQLTALSFISSSKNSDPSSSAIGPVSLLSLGTSHVLLAGLTTTSSPQLALLLWDLAFSVLLASHTFALPSLANNQKATVTLVEALSQSNVLLVLSPPASTTSANSSSQKSRKSQNSQPISSGSSSIWAVPVSIPQPSSLANALGKAFAAKPWLAASPVDEPSYADATEGDKQGDVEKERRKVLVEMRAAIGRGQPEGADAVFFAWEGSQTTSSLLPRYVLNTVLQSEKTGKANANVGYSSKVVRHLLERGVVSGLMVGDVDYGNVTVVGDATGGSGDGNGGNGNGLLEVLRRRGDWPSISLALKTVKDLQEVDVVACLSFVLARHRQSQAQDKSHPSDAMQVDSPPSIGVGTDADVPTLPAFLSLLLHSRFSASTVSSNTTTSLNSLNSTSNTLATPTAPISAMPTFSTPALRFAFRRYLSHVDDVICILEVLDSWMGQWAGRDVRLMPTGKAIKKAKKGQAAENENDPYADIPGMSQISTFLQPLLDTTFLTLIQTPPAYRLLRKFKAYVDGEIRGVEETGGMRGALEVFVRAQAKVLKEAREAKEGKEVKEVLDWRQRRRMLQEQAGVIGEYQLEELAF
ncbi:hypothetical protein BDP27DRAFT_1339093 [Rhodocollybia butyracea]|uniref:Uncharacterized protein n=1 Tax=Rhodocollybia butyracea TaxID=206335 RepID=A0A9P5PCR3_9AGAR|nr:hypothetical protein BDP27DRAFT_1339093 [Rhodocollybia butyracea]